MTYTRKQVVTCISIVYLIIVIALAGYAASRVCRLSIPFPRGLASATTVLPVVSGLLLEFGYDLTRRQERRQHLPRGDITRPPLVIVANTLIFIYSTVVITLLGTHAAPPSGLNCGLRERWTTLFSHKNAEAIRTIQEAYNCCGFQNSRDMAWPFPDKTHKATACEIAFGRTNSCLGPWKGEEQRLAGILMATVGLVFLWQFLIIVIPTQRESWLHRVAPDRISRMIADERHGGRDGPRQAIDYLPNFSRYSDRVEEEAGDVEAGNEGQRTIDGAPQQAKNALTNGNRDEESEEEENALPENEWLRA